MQPAMAAMLYGNIHLYSTFCNEHIPGRGALVEPDERCLSCQGRCSLGTPKCMCRCQRSCDKGLITAWMGQDFWRRTGAPQHFWRLYHTQGLDMCPWVECQSATTSQKCLQKASKSAISRKRGACDFVSVASNEGIPRQRGSSF